MDHHLNFQSYNTNSYSGRILYDILCQVCLDYSSGKHYGVFSCDGCAGFFKRSVRMNRRYLCKAKYEGGCLIDKTNRNQCRACRLRKCLLVGMIEDTVQDSRGPRKSTLLRRQKSMPYNSPTTATTPSHLSNNSSENGDDSSPPSSVSTGGSTPSPTFELTSPPGLTTPPAFPPVTIMTNTGDDTSPPPSVSSGRPTPSPSSSGSTTSSNSPPSVEPISPSSVHPYHQNQQPSIPYPHSIERLTSRDERVPLPSRSGPLLCAPKPKYATPDVPITIPMPWSISLESICESASRLLFMNVRWAKSVPAFTTLPSGDQMILLEESWRELFVLGAAQFALPLEAGMLMTALGFTNPSSVSSERQKNLLSEIKIFQETVATFKQMNVDPTEYACLRSVILFKTSAGLRDLPSATNLQDQAQLTLSRYVSTAYPTQQHRFGRLLLLLRALRAIAASTIEELFFRKTIGNTPIERIISDIYKSTDL